VLFRHQAGARQHGDVRIKRRRLYARNVSAISAFLLLLMFTNPGYRALPLTGKDILPRLKLKAVAGFVKTDLQL
jgi:hypothetical protein